MTLLLLSVQLLLFGVHAALCARRAAAEEQLAVAGGTNCYFGPEPGELSLLASHVVRGPFRPDECTIDVEFVYRGELAASRIHLPNLSPYLGHGNLPSNLEAVAFLSEFDGRHYLVGRDHVLPPFSIFFLDGGRVRAYWHSSRIGFRLGDHSGWEEFVDAFGLSAAGRRPAIERHGCIASCWGLSPFFEKNQEASFHFAAPQDELVEFYNAIDGYACLYSHRVLPDAYSLSNGNSRLSRLVEELSKAATAGSLGLRERAAEALVLLAEHTPTARVTLLAHMRELVRAGNAQNESFLVRALAHERRHGRSVSFMCEAIARAAIDNGLAGDGSWPSLRSDDLLLDSRRCSH